MAYALLVGFKHFEVTHIPISENQMANTLANLASNTLYQCNVELSIMDCSSIPNVAVIAIDHHVKPSWITPIFDYPKNGALPENRAEAEKVRVRTVRYSLIKDLLYRRSFSSS